MQLAVPEGGFKLGFAQAGKAKIFVLDEGDQHQAKWFVKTGETTTWSETPGGCGVVYYSNRCSLLLNAFRCILAHYNACVRILAHFLCVAF